MPAKFRSKRSLPIVKLAEIQFLTMMSVRELGQATAKMLFGWLMQLDLRDTTITIPAAEDAPGSERQVAHDDDRGSSDHGASAGVARAG